MLHACIYIYILLLHDIALICLLRKNAVCNIFVYKQRSLKCINTWNNESDRSKRACSTLAFLWQSLPVLFVMLQYVFTTGISKWRLCYISPHDSDFNPMAVIVPVMNPSQLLLLWTVKCRLSTLLVYHKMDQTGDRPTRASSGCGFRMFQTESL